MSGVPAMLGEPAAVVALLVALVAAVTDVTSRRIPNWLTFGAAGLALVYHCLTGGTAGLGGSLLGWTIGAALFFPVFALGGMGAGDVKLMAALGAWLGGRSVLWVGIYAAMAGALLAAVLVTIRGGWRPTVRNLRLLLTHWRVVGIRPVPQLTLERGNGIRLAYAVPIMVGTLATLWWR